MLAENVQTTNGPDERESTVKVEDSIQKYSAFRKHSFKSSSLLKSSIHNFLDLNFLNKHQMNLIVETYFSWNVTFKPCMKTDSLWEQVGSRWESA